MKKVIQSPLCLVVVLFGALLLVALLRKEKVSQQPLDRGCSLFESQDALLRPYVTPGKVYGIFLDGGQAPVFADEVPRLYFGAPSENPLHLVLMADWSSAAGREWLGRLQKIYNADVKASLPALALIVLPSTPEGETKSFHDMVIAVHFVANQSQTLLNFLGYISQSSMTPEVDQLREFLDKSEPEIISRVDVFLEGQRPLIEKIWQMARLQQTRSRVVLACHDSNQLISMRQVLTGSPSDQELAAFLQKAKATQDAYLSSPKGLIPVIPPSGCDCEDPTHPHLVPSP